jgi:hypothetical protein
MPRPRLDLDSVKDQILEDWNNGVTVDVIHAHLCDNGMTVSKPTLERRLKEWHLQRQ